MIEKVLEAKNLYKAQRKVERNKGACGVDGMKTTELAAYIAKHCDDLLSSIRTHRYVPDPILGVSIPKGMGKTRLLGIPTVVDRWLQQSVNQRLMVEFEYEFEPFSYGFHNWKFKVIIVLTTKLKWASDSPWSVAKINFNLFKRFFEYF